MGGMSTRNQRFRRSAARIDASSADEVALDHRHFTPCLCKSRCQRRTGLPCTHDDRVEMLRHLHSCGVRLSRTTLPFAYRSVMLPVHPSMLLKTTLYSCEPFPLARTSEA